MNDTVSINNLDGYKFQKLLDSRRDTIKLGPGTLFIDRVIVIPSNTVIIGNSTTISFDLPLKNNLFRSNKTSNIIFKNLTIQPTSRAKAKKHNGAFYVFKFLNSIDIEFNNVHFKESMNTGLALFDVTNVRVNDCSFRNFGGNTKGKNYSYDGILIGAYNIGSNNVDISNCVFENIGTDFRDVSYENDGDGIQLLSNQATVKNIKIDSCQFRGISQRGIKVQTGDSITITNNLFVKCKVALGVPMTTSSDGILFSKNTVTDGLLGISPNAPKSKKFGISRFEIMDNIFKNISGGLRTSGASQILSGLIKNNHFQHIGKYAIDGQISNTIIKANHFYDYQHEQHRRTKAAVYIWNGSSKTTIEENTFTPLSEHAYYDIYLYPETKDITVRNNEYKSKTKSRTGNIVNKSNQNKIFN